ncbi:CBO0543 family protein [Paenibacillus cremeus]|uniref:CBO0543 family protein n=1 Tax=Paenibacillus cremeus TaxID=2163881 RepID=UPI001644F299|nr:CBO0543 family protein [Paenibacillus cremeus]
MSKSKDWNQIFEKREELNQLLTSFWNHYSHLGTWQFWSNVIFLISPLIVLYYTVDRKRIFEVLFFGYTVHLLWTYIDIILEELNYLVHPYTLTPKLPLGLSMTASMIPVTYLLLYQYCTNNNRNFYIYSFLLGAVFALGFGGMSEYVGLLMLRKGMNYFYLFLIDFGVSTMGYWVTKLVLKLREENPQKRLIFIRNIKINKFRERAK